MLTATSLTKKTPDGRKILDRADIALEPGKLLALLGPSGSGKTTLMRCLSMLDAPDGGDIQLDSHVYSFPLPAGAEGVESIGPKPWPRVTAVFQQLFLWPHLTLRENCLLPCKDRAAGEAALEELVKQFGMADFIDRFPNETSGGQRQRAAIARALVLNPTYLLLDEITSALDIEQTAKVLQLLELVKAKGIGILLITHHMGFARKAADTVVFIDEGKIVESGPAGILDKPKNKRLKEFMAAVKLA
ncbi:MAG: amino acid ABC transporter ATP-binding protein [Pseudomonadaceae bacterium]|nr:amino acid ABC transporter ATP-binding protein [Pseudomonadaceae bacterium]